MPDGLIKVFAIVGVVYTVFMLIVLISVLFEIIRSAIRTAKFKHKQKHRFDKPPIGNCYCIDCDNSYRNSNGSLKCSYQSDLYVAEDWFCWRATPEKY